MPIYEYKCRKCESVLEKIQGLGDKPVSKCPSCGGKLERMMSPGAFVLKGSGFYVTDHPKSDAATSTVPKPKAQPKTEANAEAKTETKAEYKKEAKKD